MKRGRRRKEFFLDNILCINLFGLKIEETRIIQLKLGFMRTVVNIVSE